MRRSTLLAIVVCVALASLGVWWAAPLDDGSYARVTVETPNGSVTLEMAVADTPQERYDGLSGTTELPVDGMVFQYSSVEPRAFVMREMAYPLDIVFVANGAVTAIHHAPVEEPPLTRYRGRADCVLELPYNWTRRQNVTVGATVTGCFDS